MTDKIEILNVLQPKDLGQIIFYREMLRLAADGCDWATAMLDKYESSRYPIHNVFHPVLNRYVLIVVWEYYPPAGVYRIKR